MQKSSFLSYLWFVVLIGIIVNCAVNPVTGKRELMLLSEADEIKLGQQTDQQVVQTYGLYEDPTLTAYISAIGQKMAQLSHRPHLKYDFKVMDTPVINAFAVPGGYIYVTRGILAYLNDEAELAGVIGHEIGHVTARHSAKQYSKSQLAQIGLGLGSLLSESFRKYAGIAQMGVGLLFLKYSRSNEYEADQLGVEYSTKAGYDANRMAAFFETLERLHPSADGSGLPEWFSTHPNPENRVEEVRKAARIWQQKVGKKNYAVNREQFLRKIEGIVVGDDPRQGYLADLHFYHPLLKIQFPVPSNWQYNNTPSQVQLYTSDQSAVIIFTLENTASPAQAAAAFLSNSNAVAQQQDAVIVGGFPGVRLLAQLNTQDGLLQILSYFIQKDGHIFTFHGFSAAANFANYLQTFERTMKGFRKLSDPKRLNVQPDRLILKRVETTGTLKKIFESWGIPQEEIEKLAIMNGLKLEEQVPAGRLIKLIKAGR